MNLAMIKTNRPKQTDAITEEVSPAEENLSAEGHE